MRIGLKDMYLGETAEIVSMGGDALDTRRLRDMGVREGKLIDLLYFDPLISQKIIIGVDGARIGFSTRAAGSIQVRPLRTYFEVIREQAHYDRLTGCFNRHVADQIVQGEMDKFLAKKVPFTVLLADIDHFKKVNDTFGHQTGDGVLKSVSGIVRQGLRRSDVLCRWGGEEFLVLLRGTIVEEARQIAERLRRTVEDFNFPMLAGAGLTVSIGGSGMPPGRSLERMFQEADTALYSAKAAGRNRVSLC